MPCRSTSTSSPMRSCTDARPKVALRQRHVGAYCPSSRSARTAIAVWCGWAGWIPALAQPLDGGGASPPATPVWLEDPEQGFELALSRNEPILIQAGADWCVWCRRLKEEFLDPQV